MLLLVVGGLIYIAVMSAFVSAVCGYMAGLIGSSNSPLSGIGILVVIGAALLLVFGVQSGVPEGMNKALVAYALLVTAVVFANAAIANNNLQDLKTGQLVDATPWKQQVALIVGVIAGAAIIRPSSTCSIRRTASSARSARARARALPAPQAGLISALAGGVIEKNVDWSLLRISAMIGGVIRRRDAASRDEGQYLSPLAVGSASTFRRQAR
jgi:putative OPT family oligopeptide transporter